MTVEAERRQRKPQQVRSTILGDYFLYRDDENPLGIGCGVSSSVEAEIEGDIPSAKQPANPVVSPGSLAAEAVFRSKHKGRSRGGYTHLRDIQSISSTAGGLSCVLLSFLRYLLHTVYCNCSAPQDHATGLLHAPHVSVWLAHVPSVCRSLPIGLRIKIREATASKASCIRHRNCASTVPTIALQAFQELIRGPCEPTRPWPALSPAFENPHGYVSFHFYFEHG